MLDAYTIQWLKDRDALFRAREQYTLPSDNVSFEEDIEDATEFSTRVMKKVGDVIWRQELDSLYLGGYSGNKRLPAAFVMKMARLEVEREMAAEGM